MNAVAPPSMRALRVRGYGPGEGIALEHLPLPQPGDGQVRVRVAACAISFVDLLVARGGYQVRLPPPFVPGSEFAGVVDAVGPNTDTALQPGDPVCGLRQGAWAEHLTLEASRVHRLPADASLIEASALLAPFATALYALRERAQLAAGETVLVLGAGGGVGHAAVQLARQLGARVIAAASSAAKRAAAQVAGAESVVDTSSPAWKDEVKALAGARGVDIVVDTVGAESTDTAFRTLGWGGRHLMVGFAGGSIAALKTNLAIVKGAALIGVDFRQAGERDPALAATVRSDVVALYGLGRLRPLIAQTFAIDRFAEAIDAVQDRATVGRIVLDFAAAPA